MGDSPYVCDGRREGLRRGTGSGRRRQGEPGSSPVLGGSQALTPRSHSAGSARNALPLLPCPLGSTRLSGVATKQRQILKVILQRL